MKESKSMVFPMATVDENGGGRKSHLELDSMASVGSKMSKLP